MVTVGASASVLGLGSAAAPEACVRLDVAHVQKSARALFVEVYGVRASSEYD